MIEIPKDMKVIEANDISLIESSDIVYLKNGVDLELVGKLTVVDILIKCRDTYYLFANGITFVYKDDGK